MPALPTLPSSEAARPTARSFEERPGGLTHQAPGRRSGEGSASILEHLQQDGLRRPGVVRPGFSSRQTQRPRG